MGMNGQSGRDLIQIVPLKRLLVGVFGQTFFSYPLNWTWEIHFRGSRDNCTPPSGQKVCKKWKKLPKLPLFLLSAILDPCTTTFGTENALDVWRDTKPTILHPKNSGNQHVATCKTPIHVSSMSSYFSGRPS